MAEWSNDEEKRKHDMENDYRISKGKPTIEQEQEQMRQLQEKHMKTLAATRKKQGPGFWQAIIE